MISKFLIIIVLGGVKSSVLNNIDARKKWKRKRTFVQSEV